MSILSTEYDEEIAKKVYAEEKIEERIITIVKNALKMNLPVDAIVKLTGLTCEEVDSLRNDK